jgi:hypothetical protein
MQEVHRLQLSQELAHTTVVAVMVVFEDCRDD